MKPGTRTVRTVDVRLGPGQATLRLSVIRDEAGEPESLILASGFGGADSPDPFLRPSWGAAPLVLPASVIPRLRDALDALEVVDG